MTRLFLTFTLLVTIYWRPAFASIVLVKASEIGAKLDSNLLTGGGTDDTAALQKVLDEAGNGRAVHLIIDGGALVRGLNVFSNTTIECTAGGGFYLKDQSSRAVLRNAHRTRGRAVDENIAIRGCFINGNRSNQPSADIPRPDIPRIEKNSSGANSNKEADGTYLSGLQFLGVTRLVIDNVTLWNIRAFGALVANSSRVMINNIVIDHGGSVDDSAAYLNTDGLHFKGPLQFLTINGAAIRVGDDSIALNADDYETDDLTLRDDFGPYVTQGPITDVLISNIQLMNSNYGIRLLSSKQRVDRLIVNNVTGSVRGGYIVNLGHFLNPRSMGNFGTIQIENVNVAREAWPLEEATKFIQGIAKYFPLSPEMEKEYDGGAWPPYVTINGHVENLILRSIIMTPTDSNAIFRIGPDAKIKNMTLSLTLQDPSLQSVPVKLEQGAHVDRLNFELIWRGDSVDQGKIPIWGQGGSIEQLLWIDTPPMYVRAELDRNIVGVTFTQDVRGTDFSRGVTIRINGRPTSITVMTRRSTDRRNVVRYALKVVPRIGDTVTWSYEALSGDIESFDNQRLFSVSEKTVLRK